MKSRRRMLKAAIALAFLVLALLGARRLARAMTFPGSSEGFADILRAKNTPVEVVDYKSADGIVLRGAWVRASTAVVGSERPVVVYFHGNAESAAHGVWVALALQRDTFLAEYRGYAGLEGSPCEEGLYADADAALEVVRQAAGTRPLIIVGHSLGTGVAVEVARRAKPAKLILISPFTSIPDVARKLVGPLASVLVPDRFDSLQKIKEIDAPVVVIHGTRDEVVPFEHGRALSAAARSSKFVPVEGRGHNDLDLPGLVARELE